MLEKVQPLGKNWIATCRAAQDERKAHVEHTTIGLQTVLESGRREALEEWIEAATTHGAVLVAGPEWVEKRWVAVLDDRASAQKRPRA